MLSSIFRVVNGDASIVFGPIRMILQRLSIAYFAGASTTVSAFKQAGFGEQGSALRVGMKIAVTGAAGTNGPRVLPDLAPGHAVGGVPPADPPALAAPRAVDGTAPAL